MDTMTIKTKFGRQAVSKVVSKIVSDKLGCKVQINFDDISIAHAGDGKIRFEVKANGVTDEHFVKQFI